MKANLKDVTLTFQLLSYASILCAFFLLLISGTFYSFSIAAFLIIFILSWKFESSRWQISERVGTFAIVLTVPAFYLFWKFQIFSFNSFDSVIAGVLSRLILTITAIKLLQKKSDRDWIFLYLLTFFEVLLAAGLSISPLYFVVFVIYLLLVICAVIIFEIRKTSEVVRADVFSESPKFAPSENFELNKIRQTLPLRRVFQTSFVLIALIICFALPIFFLLPRVGGAGFGGNQSSVSTFTGFSDSVRLGEIGRIQQNEQVVMRVRLENDAGNKNFIRWRGVALDKFDNRGWSKAKNNKEPFAKAERDYFQINFAANRNNLVAQTVYLEPINANILFALARPVTIQGDFPIVFKDSDDSVSFYRSNMDRISYRAISDTTLPNPQILRRDNNVYSPDYQDYLQLPERIDERIGQLAGQITHNSFNRYDKAKALESYLQNNFGYTLELKAGGSEPLAEFLFDYREGHCEYFATAMAVMLRTQGIATRVVNGFQQGEYNETADIYVVKQRNAHSWVEVYFPKENAWVPFDPTPFAGQNLETGAASGIVGKFNKYIEALETFWIQYFVAYDDQEQRSLFRSVKNNFAEYRSQTSSWLTDKQNEINEWWKNARGDKGLQTSAKAVGYGMAYLAAAIFGIILLTWLSRKIIKLQIWRKIFLWMRRKNETTIVEFYERMQTVLASKGFRRAPHQTPLEFAFGLNMPEAIRITEKYNRVRFGEKDLSNDEAEEIENWLKDLQSRDNENAKI